MKVQRLRFRYRVTREGCALTQRELIEAWEAGFKAAGLALAYSEGKRKTAQISVAAPLPQGVTSDGELVEVYLSERVEPPEALTALSRCLPPGVQAIAVKEVGLQGPSLQSQLRWAEYVVEVEGRDAGEVRNAVECLLAAGTLPAEYRRDTKVRQYDLRPLVLSLRAEGSREGRILLTMKLRAEPEMTGRADQVVLALGLPTAARIHRSGLHLDDVQPAVLAYRRVGEEDQRVLLYLVRHGETEANRAGLALGREDVPLNERGLRQARCLGETLAEEPIASVYTSPLKRARQTADRIAAPHGLSPVCEDGLIEMDIGELDGLTFAEIRERHPGLLERWASPEGQATALFGSESLADVLDRAWETLASLSRRHKDEGVCAVTHNFVILSVLTQALGMELSHFRRLRHGVAAISLLEFGGDRVRVRRLNDACHLTGIG